MAAATRSERHFMRQRGAGSRDVNSIDFALDFGSHGSREERQLMRTRGAGNRKIDNIDFGFTFPTPGQSRRSKSKTPQPSTRRASRSSKTPTNNSDNAPIATKKARRSSAVTTQRSSLVENPSHASLASEAIESVPSKRRRVDAQESSTSRQSLRRRKTSGAVFSIAEEHAGDIQNDVVEGSRVSKSALNSPMVSFEDGDKENRADGTDHANSTESQVQVGTKVRPQSAARRRTRSTLEVLDNSVVPSIEANEEPSFNATDTDSDKPYAVGQLDVQSKNDPNRATSSQSTTRNPTKRRRKRKTVVLGKKRRKPSGISSARSSLVHEETPTNSLLDTTQADSTQSLLEEEVVEVDADEDEEESAEMISNSPEPLMAAKKAIPQHQRRNARRTRLSISATPGPPLSEDEDEDGTYVYEEHTPDPTTPAPKRKGTSKRKLNDQDRPTQTKKRKGNSGSSFPILTHRMANIHALPTIIEETNDEHESNHENRSSSTLFQDRAVPNAVDVLAQICRETIEAAIEQLIPQQGSQRPRGEIASKRTALQAFGKDLDQRLFDMSEAVEYRLSLEARLRKSKREKADLQAQWMEIRRQRDDVGLRADAIRRQNWENEEKSKRQWDASRLSQRIELNLDAETPREGFEFRLRSVGHTVSNGVGSCGLLNKVKSFNMQLERIAVALEGRA